MPGVSCCVLGRAGQKVPIEAVPALLPGGCLMPIRLAIPHPPLGKVPSMAAAAAPRD